MHFDLSAPLLWGAVTRCISFTVHLQLKFGERYVYYTQYKIYLFYLEFICYNRFHTNVLVAIAKETI